LLNHLSINRVNFVRRMTKKKDILEYVTIEDFAAEAKCLTRVDGKVVFVENSSPGDIVDIRITRKKKNYLEATPVHFHQFSTFRQEPFCSHYGSCGGCRWQHINYEKQLDFKYQQVRDQFERIGRIKDFELLPVIGSASQKFYRNKLEYTFSNRRWISGDEIESGIELDRNGLGFHKPGQFDKVLDINTCHLQDDLTNRIRNAFKNYAKSNSIPFYDLKEHVGFLRNLIIRNSNTGEWMVILQVKYYDKILIQKLLNFLNKTFPEITSLYYIINSKRNESYQDLEAIHFSGRKYIMEKMEELVFQIGPKSFFQTNSDQAYRLYSVVREFANIKHDEIVYDLYSGTGSIALFIAKHAKKVIGFEYVEEAVMDAKLNSDLNKIGNTFFIAGDIKETIKSDIIKKFGKPDVVISDPPRAGMHKDVIAGIIDAKPLRIIYVSCNPATQARDIELLKEYYQPKKAQPVDMFPQTHHIENIALLELKDHG